MFQDGRVRVSRGGEERGLRELSPEEWSALSDDFMNGTTYDLDIVTQALGRRPGGGAGGWKYRPRL